MGNFCWLTQTVYLGSSISLNVRTGGEGRAKIVPNESKRLLGRVPQSMNS